MKVSFHRPPPGDLQNYGFYWITEEFDENDPLMWARFGDDVYKRDWAPGVFSTDRKCNATFLHAQLVPIDFDEGATIKEALSAFADFKHIIGTTKNHQKIKNGKPPCDRFRVILIADAEMRFQDFVPTVTAAAMGLTFDPDALRPAQYMRRCYDVISFKDTGKLVPVVRGVLHPPAKIHPMFQAGTGALTPFISHCLTRPIEPSKRNSTMWRCAKDLFRTGRTAEQIKAAILKSPTCRPEPGQTRYKWPENIREIDAMVRSAEQSFLNDVAKLKGTPPGIGPGDKAQQVATQIEGVQEV